MRGIVGNRNSSMAGTVGQLEELNVRRRTRTGRDLRRRREEEAMLIAVWCVASRTCPGLPGWVETARKHSIDC